VDHNRLLPTFLPPSHDDDETASVEPVVSAIIDHHADEDLYLSANPRIVTTGAGSCASLVSLYFQTHYPTTPTSSSLHVPLPKELATLLLSAIMIDTGGLKAGGKATDKDLAAVEFLYPLSSLADSTINASSSSSINLQGGGGGGGRVVPSPLTNLSQELLSTKRNVSHLSSSDLLSRDYKQYLHPTTLLLPQRVDLRVGLATVPIGLEEWLTRSTPSTPWSSFLSSLEEFTTQHNLQILGILTSFRSLSFSGKAKHKREILMYFPSSTWTEEMGGLGGREKVWKEVVGGLEGSGELDLKKWKEGEGLVDGWGGEGGGRAEGKVWRQGNVEATRKVTAPIMKEILEGGGVGDADQ